MAAGDELVGRRIQPYMEDGKPRVQAGDFEPGDYCGPIMGYTGDKPAVFFLKPGARDPGVPPRRRSIQHIVSPPHTFIENDDGTLTVEPSISNLTSHGDHDDGWHGYLTGGVWREV